MLPLAARIGSVVSAGNSIAFGSVTAWRLHSYHLPVSLLLSCALCCAFVMLKATDRALFLWSASTYRCTVPGCAFTVRTQRVSAGERRRWQETAADHPAHDTAR
ncbi:hypothetical protein [Streptomyces sp. NPDC006879]|uniref:hypothetical protein n=1 Tax=Streptomyces sp. NPDC006879 TaxID=3364767 RepID=UPI0036CA36DA